MEPENTQTHAEAPKAPEMVAPEMPPAGKPPAGVFSRIGLGLFLFILIQQVVGTVAYVVVGALAPQWISSGWFNWVVSYLPLYLVAFPVLLAVLRGVPTIDAGPLQLHRASAWGLVRLFCAAMALVYCVNILTAVVNELSGAGVSNAVSEMMLTSDPWVNLFFACLVAPVMEELIFRQMLYKRLIGFGGKTFIWFSALVFGLLHPNVFQFFYAVLLGLMFAGLRYWTGKLWPCILLHVVVNFTGSGLPVILLSFAGQDEAAMMQVITVLGFVQYFLIAAGLVAVIQWLAAGRKGFVLENGPRPAPSAKTALLNPGVILYIVLVLALIVVSLFAPM